ncbi:cellulase family glycosylhydrolase [Streptomyces solicathayae]|uniref:Cellulase family glycosylhydrolase n=1 Tax=Streptomyces solicathayae TaxID=3081768 RepID=A0ABZ0LRN5_9ACTN|nr:cellulase family glycosylhydrolase [Streptomyces sp. HUAS YS2]WOX22112.1 cellulase family glycosylhydrolase [Streptomyces sp. HUAS YS2]
MLRTTLAATLVVASLLAPTAAGAETATRAETGGDGIPALTDSRGRVVTLRGWNLADKSHSGDAALSAITEKHFRDMRAKGYNTARLLVFWDDLEPRPGQYSQAYLRKIERVLDWAAKHDVKVILDAHQDIFGPAFESRGIPAWATRTDGLPFKKHPDDWFSEYFEPAVQRAFTHLYEDEDLQRAQARMWRVLADRFEDHPAVFGYDPINEPMGEMREGEDLATAARRIERDQITPMYNRIADAIRQVDRDSWIFVEPTPIVGEGVPTGMGKIDDPKVVYAPHFYNGTMEAGGDYDPSARWIENYEAAVTQYAKEHKVPLAVGEWGPLNNSLPNMNRFYREAMASLGRYSSGWTGWEWCYGAGYCAVDAAGAFRANKELTAEPYAEAVAGRVRSDAYDASAGAYRLEYEAAGRRGSRVTELSLPEGEWKVAVTGKAVSVRKGQRVWVYAVPGARVVVTVNHG